MPHAAHSPLMSEASVTNREIRNAPLPKPTGRHGAVGIEGCETLMCNCFDWFYLKAGGGKAICCQLASQLCSCLL